jgi:hypothetical protein
MVHRINEPLGSPSVDGSEGSVCWYDSMEIPVDKVRRGGDGKVSAKPARRIYDS